MKTLYNDFLTAKMAISSQSGFDVDLKDITSDLYPHVKASVKWAIKGGCRAIFSNFGLHKTVTQLEILYSLARWQIDAHGFWRSSGNRMITQNDIRGLSVDRIKKLYDKFESSKVYNYEDHVKFAEVLAEEDKLPKTFMAVDPKSNTEMVWDDVIRMRTLNARQTNKKRMNHVCPLQFDIIDRCVERFSNKGDLVYDPFGGIGSTGYRSILLGRKTFMTELNHEYYKDACSYLSEAEMDILSPTLFDLIEVEQAV